MNILWKCENLMDSSKYYLIHSAAHFEIEYGSLGNCVQTGIKHRLTLCKYLCLITIEMRHFVPCESFK